MKLAAVVVFYHPSEENIENVKNYEKYVDKCYIVDNSEDEIQRCQNGSKIEYIKYGDNLGIAKALNEGAKRAIKDGYQWLLTMDQDSKITKDIIAKMKQYLMKHAKEKIGLVSPYHDIHSDEVVPDVEEEEMIEVMTSGNIISLNAYKEIGGFKDWLFIDCVDTDYCMNLHIHGYKVLRLNRVRMEHHLGHLEVHKLFGKSYPCYNHSPMRRYYIVRNNLYIRQMYGDIYPDYCAHLIRVQKGQVKRIIAFEHRKFQKLKMMYQGYKDFKKGIKGKKRLAD